MKKISRASLENKSIRFENIDEQGRPCHRYVRLDGKYLAGVTTLVNQLDKPYLIPWAAKCAVKFLGWYDSRYKTQKDVLYSEEMLNKIKGLDVVGFVKLLRDAKDSHRKNKEDAGDLGTLIHKWLENYINKEELPEIPESISPFVQRFKDWETANKVKWIATELLVGNDDYAGTLDALAYVNGELSIIDFKTSNQISKEYFLQTAAYKQCVDKTGNIVMDRIILRIDKQTGMLEVKTLPRESYESDIKIFNNLIDINRWNLYVQRFL